MKRRFIILVDPENAPRAVRDEITKMLRDFGSWWHRFPYVWLLRAGREGLVTREIRDAITEIAPDIEVLVLRLPAGRSGWAGHGKPEKFNWIGLFWNLNEEDEDQI